MVVVVQVATEAFCSHLLMLVGQELSLMSEHELLIVAQVVAKLTAHVSSHCLIEASSGRHLISHSLEKMLLWWG